MARRVEKSRRNDPTTYRAANDPQLHGYTDKKDAEERARFLDAMDKEPRTTRR